MTAQTIISEIKELSPPEQAEVIQFALHLAESRQLTGEELGNLARKLATSTDPLEVTRLKSALTRGFYGE